MVNITRALLTDLIGNVEQSTLRARLDDNYPAAFLCGFHEPGATAAIMDVHGGTKTLLSLGRYRVEVEITCGDTLHRGEHELSVGTNPDATYWIP